MRAAVADLDKDQAVVDLKAACRAPARHHAAASVRQPAICWFRGAGASVGRSRVVRRAVVLGDVAYPRESVCEWRSEHATGDVVRMILRHGLLMVLVGDRGGRARRIATHAIDAKPGVRHERVRSAHVRDGGRGSAAGGSVGLLHSGAPGEPDGSHACVTGGLTPSRGATKGAHAGWCAALARPPAYIPECRASRMDPMRALTGRLTRSRGATKGAHAGGVRHGRVRGLLLVRSPARLHSGAPGEPDGRTDANLRHFPRERHWVAILGKRRSI